MTAEFLRILLRGDHFANDLALHIGQAEVAAGVAERQLFVIEARQMQDRGMQVVHVADVLHSVDAEFVGVAVGYAAFRSAAPRARDF